MAFTYSKIQNITVPSGTQNAIVFTNIPQNYSDLLIKYSIRSTRAADRTEAYAEFNGLNTSSLYSNVNTISYNNNNIFQWKNTTSTSMSAMNVTAATSTGNVYSPNEMYISNYSSSTVAKSISYNGNAENFTGASFVVGMHAGLFNSTSPITSIKFATDTGDFAQGSSITLYGIRKDEY